MKLKKYIYPFVFPIILLVTMLLCSLLISDVGIGGAVIAIFAIIIIVGVILPCNCFLYGRKILSKEKRKYLFTFYNSSIITLFYLLSFCMEGETYLYSAILFAWAELWTVLPLLIPKKKLNKE